MKERERMRVDAFAETRLGGSLSRGLELEQLRGEFRELADDRFSIFDVAAFYALSTPAEDYYESLVFSMSGNFIEVLRDEISSVTTREEVESTLEETLRQQLKMFEHNFSHYRETAGKPFLRKLRTVLRPLINLAEEEDMIELSRVAEAADDKLRSVN